MMLTRRGFGRRASGVLVPARLAKPCMEFYDDYPNLGAAPISGPVPFVIVGTPQRVSENAGGAAPASLNVTAGNGLIGVIGYRNNLGGTFTNVTVTGESNMSIAGGAE